MNIEKIKTALIVLICLLIIVSVIGCVADNRSTVSEHKNILSEHKNIVYDNIINVVSVIAKELTEPNYGEEDTEYALAARGANDFAFRLSASLAKEADNKNFVCSPYSVWVPLAALVNATDEEYKPILLTALNAAGLSEDSLNNTASRMLYGLTRQEQKKFAEEYEGNSHHDPLKIVNAIFVDNDVTLKKDFAQAFMDYYRGYAINVDFPSQEAVDAVNKWAAENTEGLITEIIQEFDPDTVAAITNAIYFSDRWSQEFNTEKTTEDTFYSPTGETKAFYMMSEGDVQVYYEDDNIQAMPLEFRTGGGMYILLPKDGDAVKVLSSMTNDYFNEIQKNSVYATGKLLLPRFSIENDVMELKDTLISLGVPLFDEKAAPLTGGLIEEDMPIWLSSAVHKAVINIDEKGTTAAAVTVEVAVYQSGREPIKSFEMNCNKPFVFILYDNTYDGGKQVLFTGFVNQTQP